MTVNVSWEDELFKKEIALSSKCKEISLAMCRKDKTKPNYVSCWIFGVICPIDAYPKYSFVSNNSRCSEKDSKECKEWRTKIKMIAKLSM